MNLKYFHPKIFKDKHPRLADNLSFKDYCKNESTHTDVMSNLVATAGYNAMDIGER